MIDLEKRRLRYERYNQSEKGIAAKVRYQYSEKGIATRRRYRNGEAGKAAKQRFFAKHPHYYREHYHELQERFSYYGNPYEVLPTLKFIEAFRLGNYKVVSTVYTSTRFERLKSKLRRLLRKLQRKQPVPDPWGDEEM